MRDEMHDKNSHSLYLSNEAMAMAQELADNMAIGRSAVFEMAIRATYHARSAVTYEVALQLARAEVQREMQGEEGADPQ